MPLAQIMVSALLTAGAAPAPSGADAGARAVLATTAPIERSVAREAAPVTRARASRIARRAVERRFGQPARVTGAEREDDFGARWEIEVTRRDGVEFDVYVNARGVVVRVVRTPTGG